MASSQQNLGRHTLIAASGRTDLCDLERVRWASVAANGHIFVGDEAMRIQTVAALVLVDGFGIVVDFPCRAAYFSRLMDELAYPIFFSRPEPRERQWLLTLLQAWASRWPEALSGGNFIYGQRR